MPNRLSDEKVNAIAAEYCTNGFKKVAGMLSLGYSESYANSKTGLKIYDNDRVKRAISRIQAVAVAKTGFTVEQAQIMYKQAFDLGKKTRQPAAMNGSVTGIARLYGMDRDAGGGREQTVIIISPKAESRAKPVDSKELENEMLE